MASGFTVRPNQYFDSVFLMGVNKRLSAAAGVRQSAVLMGSPANKGLLAEIGVAGEGIEAARPNDLIVAVIADTPEIVESVLARLEEWLASDQESGGAPSPRTLADGLTAKPAANLAVISVPGEYAAAEARKAIDAGLRVSVPATSPWKMKSISNGGRQSGVSW
jgi:succinyl-CoA synthetase alpha subunit